MPKRWVARYDGHEIVVEHWMTLSLRAKVRLVVDDVPVAETPFAFLPGRQDIDAAVPSSGRTLPISARVTWDRSGLRRIAQIRIGGQVVLGPQQLVDFYDVCLPKRGALWYYLHSGVPAGLIYACGMLLATDVTPRQAAFMAVFFSLAMGASSFWLSWLAHRRS
jgi:hypothetical protein